MEPLIISRKAEDISSSVEIYNKKRQKKKGSHAADTQRWNIVKRWINVKSTLFQRCVPTGAVRILRKGEWRHFYSLEDNWKRFTLKWKNLFPVGAKSFFLDWTPFLKGISVQENKQENKIVAHPHPPPPRLLTRPHHSIPILYLFSITLSSLHSRV